MFKKSLSFALIVFLLNLTFAVTVKAAAVTDKDTTRAKKVKARILKIGTGDKVRIRILLRNNLEAKGYIREANDSSFVIVDGKSGITTTIPYEQVSRINVRDFESFALKAAKGAALFVGIVGGLAIILVLGLRGS